MNEKVETLTVGKLRKLLENVPDDLKVELCSDTGVDQGEGNIIVTDAFPGTDCFNIYVNDYEEDY